jgi:hypothetical protein
MSEEYRVSKHAFPRQEAIPECPHPKQLHTEKNRLYHELEKIEQLPIDSKMKESVSKPVLEDINTINNQLVTCEEKCKGKLCGIKNTPVKREPVPDSPYMKYWKTIQKVIDKEKDWSFHPMENAFKKTNSFSQNTEDGDK